MTICPLSQMISDRGMNPQAASPLAATGSARLDIHTYAMFPGKSAYAASQSF